MWFVVCVMHVGKDGIVSLVFTERVSKEGKSIKLGRIEGDGDLLFAGHVFSFHEKCDLQST